MSFKPFHTRLAVLLLLCSLFAAGFRSAAQQSAETGDCLPTQFTMRGAHAVVTPGDANNVRAEPSTSGALVGRIGSGVTFNIVNQDAVCAEGYLWRHISAPGIDGWTVEANADTYFIVPYTVPEERVVASIPANGGDFVVESNGVHFVVPPQLNDVVRVLEQPEVGMFDLQIYGARPSAVSLRLVEESNWGHGTIEVYPYADAEQYWSDGDWLETLLRDQPPLAQAAQERPSGLPQTPLPINGAELLFNGVPAYVPFGSGNGIRYVTYYAMGNVTFGRDTIFTVIYLGITTDRAFLIAGEFPIRIPTEIIPIPGNDVRTDEGYASYLRQFEANLAALSTSAYTPDLAALDALFGSLRITDNGAVAAAIP